MSGLQMVICANGGKGFGMMGGDFGARAGAHGVGTLLLVAFGAGATACWVLFVAVPWLLDNVSVGWK